MPKTDIHFQCVDNFSQFLNIFKSNFYTYNTLEKDDYNLGTRTKPVPVTYTCLFEEHKGWN